MILGDVSHYHHIHNMVMWGAQVAWCTQGAPNFLPLLQLQCILDNPHRQVQPLSNRHCPRYVPLRPKSLLTNHKQKPPKFQITMSTRELSSYLRPRSPPPPHQAAASSVLRCEWRPVKDTSAWVRLGITFVMSRAISSSSTSRCTPSSSTFRFHSRCPYDAHLPRLR
jgi:hypothetical protein